MPPEVRHAGLGDGQESWFQSESVRDMSNMTPYGDMAFYGRKMGVIGAGKTFQRPPGKGLGPPEDGLQFHHCGLQTSSSVSRHARWTGKRREI